MFFPEGGATELLPKPKCNHTPIRQLWENFLFGLRYALLGEAGDGQRLHDRNHARSIKKAKKDHAHKNSECKKCDTHAKFIFCSAVKFAQACYNNVSALRWKFYLRGTKCT